jgi:DNA-binding beta-propeller fold protein YncE
MFDSLDAAGLVSRHSVPGGRKTRKSSPGVVVAFVLLALLVAACGGSTPNSAVNPAAKSPISSPEAWQKVATAEGEVTGVAVDGLGNIYAAEVENDQIEKFGRDGKRLARWGQSGSGLGQLSRPAKIAVDAAGNVYVSEPTAGDRGNDRIQKFSPDGVALAVWGTHGSGPGQFDHPVGLVLDRQGNIYVADQYNKRIQKLSADGRPLAQWGGPGAAPGQSFSPYGIAVDAEGNVFCQTLTTPAFRSSRRADNRWRSGATAVSGLASSRGFERYWSTLRETSTSGTPGTTESRSCLPKEISWLSGRALTKPNFVALGVTPI